MELNEIRQIGANETALRTEIERFGLEANEANPAGIVTDFVEGKYLIADDQESSLVPSGAIIYLLESLRAIPTEDGPDFFWQTVADFEEKSE